jgi:hypothetical protein
VSVTFSSTLLPALLGKCPALAGGDCFICGYVAWIIITAYGASVIGTQDRVHGFHISLIKIIGVEIQIRKRGVFTDVKTGKVVITTIQSINNSFRFYADSLYACRRIGVLELCISIEGLGSGGVPPVNHHRSASVQGDIYHACTGGSHCDTLEFGQGRERSDGERAVISGVTRGGTRGKRKPDYRHDSNNPDYLNYFLHTKFPFAVVPLARVKTFQKTLGLMAHNFVY